MKRFIITSLVVLFALPVAAGTINFDEHAPANSNRVLLSEEYADMGVHFMVTDDGSVWSGLSDGDPGGWLLEGTNGSAFAGFNGRSYEMTILMDEAVENFSLDVARSGGSSEAATFTLTGFLAGTLVEDVVVDIGTMAINQWTTASLSQPVDEVHLIGSSGLREPFGVDNLQWGGDPVGSAMAVTIDVKPGNSQNVVNYKSNGVVWVAILTTVVLDEDNDEVVVFYAPDDIDMDTVALGPDGAEPQASKEKDANKDGYDDLYLKFKVADIGLTKDTTDVTLWGLDENGRTFAGTDLITTVPPKGKSKK